MYIYYKKIMDKNKKLIKDSIDKTIQKNDIKITDNELSNLLHEIANEFYFDDSDSPKSVGDIITLLDLEYFQWIEDGKNIKDFPYEKYNKAKIVYITPNNDYILEEVNNSFNGNPSFDGMLFSGKSIKETYHDFNGDDNKYYAITYSKDNPIYQ